MNPKNPLISILIAFRNREPIVVQRCLESIDNQSFKDFDVVFVDYGSEPKIQTSVAELVQKFPFVKYFYLETRGWFWNKSYTLNFAYRQTQADKIIILDIDLILPPTFFTKIQLYFTENKLLKFRFHRLFESFKDYQNLWTLANNPQQIAEKSAIFADGNIMVKKEFIEKAQGYDEFYRFWGVEDKDMVMVLETWGLESEYISFADALVFHQWHSKISQNLPKGWQKTIDDYFNQKKNNFEKNKQAIVNQGFKSKKLNHENRPALQKVFNNDLDEKQKFQFDFPKEQAWILFQKQFKDLKSNEYVWLKQDFSILKTENHSRLGALMRFFNRFFEKIRISYRLVDLAQYYSEVIDYQEVHDFLFYFILHQESEILDYYFEAKNQEISLIIYKK